MTTTSRAARSLACILLLSQSIAAPVYAQASAQQAAAGTPPRTSASPASTAPAPTPKPWLYKNSDVPPDPDWHFGELDNGLRYAVRHNGVPPGQVSIRVRVDVGSLYERNSERGYAHLLEHMLFRESKYIPEGTAIATFQRLGASFGTDTNAQTTTTETVFKLDIPNAKPAKLDTVFKLLSGMITAPTLSALDLHKDLPIVLSEMRDSGGAARRVQDAMQETLYAGQPLADREPIGTLSSLRKATPQSVRAFYTRWYRPQTVTVIVAGDAPVPALEGYVKTWFGGWHVPGKVTPQPSFGEPAAPKGAKGPNPVGATRVMVEPDLPTSLMYAVLRPWHQVNDTIKYNQGMMIDGLAQAIINRRLERRARAGGSFLTASVDQEKIARSADATFVSVTPLGDDWKAALHDVRAVIADAMTRPPTQAEIDREVAEMDVSFQVPVEQQSILPGAKLADDLVNALDIHETVAAPKDVLDIFRKSKPLFTPQAVLAHTRSLFSGTVTRAMFVAQKPGIATDAQLHAALTEPVAPDKTMREHDKPVSFATLPPIGKPAAPVTNTPTGLLGIRELTFANGVKALLWPVTEEPGRVMVKVRFGGGYNAVDPKDAVYLSLGDMALVGSGEATLDQNDMDRISTGRKLGFDFDIDDGAFQFQAETRPSDLADQLYLFAAKLDMPRWDKGPLERAKAASKIQYDTYSASPQSVLSRDLNFYQHNRDPRYATPTPAQIDKADMAGFQRVWTRELASGPVEVQIYGDFDEKAAVADLTRTFGALKPRTSAAAQPIDLHGAPAPSTDPIVLHHHGDADQAAAVISWPTGGGADDIAQSRKLQVLTQLFSNRLMEAMREKLGLAYSPYVFSSWPSDEKTGGAITAVAQIEPDKVPLFFQTADDIAQNLIDNPPTADELERVIEPLRQQVTRATSSTAFFMDQLQGATWDPKRFGTIRTLMNDYTQTTPQAMQALAAQYLGKGKSWRLEVLPQAKSSETAPDAGASLGLLPGHRVKAGS